VSGDDLAIIAAELRFLANSVGGIDQLPFDPFAAIERLHGRVLPELPEGWQVRAMDGEIWLLRATENPPRCWEVFGAGATFAAAVNDALAKIGPDGFPFDDPEDEGVDYESLGWEAPTYLRRTQRRR
jgi:hypothetical protein